MKNTSSIPIPIPIPILIHILIFLLTSCSPDSVSIPDNIIQPDKLVPLLVDMHKADAEKQVNRIYYADSTRSDTVNYGLIFSKHGVTRIVYDSSMSFYTRHPEIFDKVYDQVIESLNQEKIEKETAK